MRKLIAILAIFMASCGYNIHPYENRDLYSRYRVDFTDPGNTGAHQDTITIFSKMKYDGQWAFGLISVGDANMYHFKSSSCKRSKCTWYMDNGEVRWTYIRDGLMVLDSMKPEVRTVMIYSVYDTSYVTRIFKDKNYGRIQKELEGIDSLSVTTAEY